MCCTDSGGVIDDLIAYYVSDDEVFLVPNAANTAAVVAAMQSQAPAGLTITDEHRSYAVLAVQGPKSAEVLAALGLPTEMDYMGYADAEFAGVPVRVCRTGYTGEHGYELLPPWDRAGGGVRRAGRRGRRRPAASWPGSAPATPCAPRWVTRCTVTNCRWTSRRCRRAAAGRSAGRRTRSGAATRCSPRRQAGPRRLLRGLRAVGRGVLRPDLTVLDGDTPVGVTTSGTFSPTLKVGIALALIDTDAGIADGQTVTVDVRGRPLECEVVQPPFVEAKTR